MLASVLCDKKCSVSNKRKQGPCFFLGGRFSQVFSPGYQTTSMSCSKDARNVHCTSFLTCLFAGGMLQLGESDTPAYLVDTTEPAAPSKPTAVAAGPEQTDEFGLPMHA
jgi:hypothetical protein